MKQPERTALRDQARGWRIMMAKKLADRYGLELTACILDRNDLLQACRMSGWKVDICEKVLAFRDEKRALLNSGPGFEHVRLIDGRGRGSMESYMRRYPDTNYISYDGYSTCTRLPVIKIAKAMRAVAMMRNNKPFVMSMVFLPENRNPGERLWETGDAPGCMTRAFLKVCREYGLIVENLDHLFQPYEGYHRRWKNGQEKIGRASWRERV